MSLANLNTEKLNKAIDKAICSAMNVLDTILSAKTSTRCGDGIVGTINALDFQDFEPAMYLNIEFSGDAQGDAVLLFNIDDLSVILGYLTGAETELDEMGIEMLNEILAQSVSEFVENISNTLKIKLNETITGLEVFSDYSVVSSAFESASDGEAMAKSFDYEISGIVSGKGMFCFSEPFIHSLSNAIGNGTNSNTQQTVVSESSGVEVQHPVFPKFDTDESEELSRFVGGNMDLLMDVPVNVCVEIGKTRRKMKEVMNYSQGSVILLDKRAGEPVDITVNGQIVAKGEVIVIDNNFGVRITEIVNSKEFSKKS